MPKRELVVIGTSAGGFDALQTLCKGLPADLQAAVLIVSHLSPTSDSVLPRVLSKVSRLPAQSPQDGEKIQQGVIYVAPPDHHMIVEDGVLRIVRGPRENRHRPAIDPLFRSAVAAYGNRVIGVVLTGMLDDGTSGAMVIEARGGKVIVQDPATAMYSPMPQSALERVRSATVAKLEDIAGLIASFVSGRSTESGQIRLEDSARSETRMAKLDMGAVERQNREGKPSPFACPECGGVLWEMDQSGLLRFRCRVGHAYTVKNLRVEQRQAVENALWSALRALEENASLYHRMADRARDLNYLDNETLFKQRAANVESNARTLRDFLLHVSESIDETDDPAELDVEAKEPPNRTGT